VTKTTITAKAQVSLPPKKSYAELNSRSKPTEFFGPIGTTIVTFATPLSPTPSSSHVTR
jgi:delta14-sterol reductase